MTFEEWLQNENVCEEDAEPRRAYQAGREDAREIIAELVKEIRHLEVTASESVGLSIAYAKAIKFLGVSKPIDAQEQFKKNMAWDEEREGYAEHFTRVKP